MSPQAGSPECLHVRSLPVLCADCPMERVDGTGLEAGSLLATYSRGWVDSPDSALLRPGLELGVGHTLLDIPGETSERPVLILSL